MDVLAVDRCGALYPIWYSTYMVNYGTGKYNLLWLSNGSTVGVPIWHAWYEIENAGSRTLKRVIISSD
jgi:hypothetical protein